MPVSISSSEKKTIETAYLTVEQVRDAVNTWLAAQPLARSARAEAYRKCAQRIAYYQRRNQQARKSHTKKTLQRLQKLRLDPRQLRSCSLDDP